MGAVGVAVYEDVSLSWVGTAGLDGDGGVLGVVAGSGVVGTVVPGTGSSVGAVDAEGVGRGEGSTATGVGVEVSIGAGSVGAGVGATAAPVALRTTAAATTRISARRGVVFPGRGSTRSR